MSEMSIAEIGRTLTRIEKDLDSRVRVDRFQDVIDRLERLERAFNRMLWAVLSLFAGVVSMLIVNIASRGLP